MARSKRSSVMVLYNLVGEDEYEKVNVKIKKKDFDAQLEGIDEVQEVTTEKEDIDAIVKALRKEGYRVRSANIKDDFDSLLRILTSPRPDVVFNLVEFFNDDPLQEDRVAALYDLLGIPYTGAPPLTLALCQRKGLTKQILKANDIRTPRYKIVKKKPVPKLTGLRYPLIVKPAWEDASAGIDEESVVEDRGQLEKRVHMVLSDYEQPVLIEEFISGRELGVSVIGNKDPQVLPIEEIDFTGLPPKYRGIISFETKWDPLKEVFHKSELVCPAQIPKTVEKRAKKTALRTYQVMGCRDYARIDMRMDRRGRLFVLEVNPNPDLAEGVAFMASAEAAGMTLSKALRKIVEAALARGEKRGG